MSNIKLKPDRTLLNPDFDGYKLSNSSDIVTSFSKSIIDGLFTIKQSYSTDTSSYLHTRSTTLFNYLTEDPHDDSSEPCTVYCFNSRGQLLAFDYSKELLFCEGRCVWQTDIISDITVKSPLLLLQKDCKNQPSTFGALPPSLKFADCTTAVASDGNENIFVVHTADRNPQQHHTWVTHFTASPGSYKILDARIISPVNDSSSSTLEILALTTASPTSIPAELPHHLNSSCSLHVIYWLTLKCVDGSEYSVDRERLYVTKSPLQYCHFNQLCDSIIVLGNQLCYLIHDSLRPCIFKEFLEIQKLQDRAETEARQFIFYQNDDGITVRLSTGTKKNSEDVRIVVSSSQVTVSQKSDHSVILKENFEMSVAPETATWIIEGGTIEITVCKAESGIRWQQLFKETDLKGEEVMGEEQLQELKEKLRHLTTDSWEKGGMGDKPAYNPSELEACDDADSDLLLLKVPGEADCMQVINSSRAMLGNTQYLATVSVPSGEPPMFCLRHDVDGLVYRIESSFNSPSDEFCHSATFDAFGYVKASKTMAKYTSASQDCAYVAVCDTNSRIYVFCRPLPTTGRELKNRKTGKICKKVARQLLITLPCHEETMGMVTLNDLIVVCTKRKMYAYSLNLEEA